LGKPEEAFQAWATGYVVKESATDRLVQALEAVSIETLLIGYFCHLSLGQIPIYWGFPS